MSRSSAVRPNPIPRIILLMFSRSFFFLPISLLILFYLVRDVLYCVRNKLMFAYDKFSSVPDVTLNSSIADCLVLLSVSFHT